MRLVSYDDGQVGCLAGDQVIPLPARTMRDVIAAWDGERLAMPEHGECPSPTRRRSSRPR
jgi:hypothetical protein